MIENNKAIIVRLSNVRPHSNADRLKLATVYGCQIIVGLDCEEGDLGIYFPIGVRLSEEFAAQNDLIRRKDEGGNQVGGMFEKLCRVRAQKFRGENSEGFWTPVSSLEYTGVKPTEGDCFDTLNGKEICRKYIPKRNPGATGKRAKSGTTTMFSKHLSTSQLRMNYDAIHESDLLVITSKMHGTSQRIGHVLEPKRGNWLQKLWWKWTNNVNEWTYLIGTRNFICGSELGEPFHSNEFRHRASKPFLNNLHKNELIFYEVIGYESEGKFIMPGSDTDSLSKESRKKYGKRVEYTYGCEDGELDIYVYRIAMVNEDGILYDLSWDDVKTRCNQLGVKHVIEMDRFIFDGDYEAFKEKVEEMTEGVDLVAPNQPREGIVIRIDRNPLVLMKNKGFDFKTLEGILYVPTIEDES
jgi:hypothetical protein